MELENEKVYKMLMVHINDSQARRLEDFLERIDIHNYAVENNVNRAVNEKVKQKQSKTWPGSSSAFFIPMKENKVDDLLVKLKTFRMALPKGIVMSLWIVPFDRVIKSFYEEDIPVDDVLLEELKEKFIK